MTLTFKTVALFGANGQVGKALFKALINCKNSEFHVIAFVSPNSSFSLDNYGDGSRNATVKRVDLNEITTHDLAVILADAKVDVAISALGSNIIQRQGMVQDAAAEAGVKRFYPSEFGMHQVVWLPGEGPYVHPLWDLRMRYFELSIRHPAVQSGKMSYTCIGCGEFYDADQEPLFCPWFEKDESVTANGYTIQCVGDPAAKMDYSSLRDVANFLVATLRHPELSENKVLGFRNDYISFSEVADLLQKHSGKPVKIQTTPFNNVRGILDDPSLAPKEWWGDSTFSLDFFMILRLVQGQGVCWRPPGFLHNDLFPEVKTGNVDEYFKGLFAK
ncbi:hypothetical protein FE257_010307 [Aspergillus nanangensis]|uniref:NmrA-like domain-containing protein n=1 Tax=Aspergillus nanangensis TaxID=2582783 RepID=A0AAD4CKL2_ASPNN|nr:hypothetical protein FE257_010307 [Aspergillus nanangensis]